MKTIQKSVLLSHSAENMFALVTDIPRYPEFLPWCDRSEVLSQSGHVMVARIGLSLGGIQQSFTTRNTHVLQREVHLKLVDGPFSQLDGDWIFSPLGDPAAPPQDRACKVEFRLHYGFSSQTLAALVGPVFDKIATSLVDAFVKRADAVYRT